MFKPVTNHYCLAVYSITSISAFQEKLQHMIAGQIQKNHTIMFLPPQKNTIWISQFSFCRMSDMSDFCHFGTKRKWMFKQKKYTNVSSNDFTFWLYKWLFLWQKEMKKIDEIIYVSYLVVSHNSWDEYWRKVTKEWPKHLVSIIETVTGKIKSKKRRLHNKWIYFYLS